ncbi:MAG: hypothetical protein RLY78_2650 [Pseudomonadota bacterium]|jgi:acyl dehydratase
MRFADFHAGQVIDAGRYPLDEAEILSFARQWDPQWFHTDPAAAADGPYGGLIASGWQTCGVAMRLMVQAVLDGSETVGSPGLEQLHWYAPVRPGDTLQVQGHVLEVRRSASKPHIGVLRWRWTVLRQDDVLAMDLVATSLFDLRRGPQEGVAPLAPSLAVPAAITAQGGAAGAASGGTPSGAAVASGDDTPPAAW